MLKYVNDFLRLESAGGILLVGAAIVAMVLANTPLVSAYDWVLEMPVEIRVGPLHIAKPLLLWVNDGLMAVFFFLVGLELKREVIDGELSNISNVMLPAVGAVGGMLVPALIYAFINRGDEIALAGWAIPAATDIAFALGILTLLGKRVPTALKVFLVSLAIFDDIGADSYQGGDNVLLQGGVISNFAMKLLPHQGLILVPGGADTRYRQPTPSEWVSYAQVHLALGRRVELCAFAWRTPADQPVLKGICDQPALRAQYEAAFRCVVA